MGNQAHQSRELELWQMVSPSKNQNRQNRAVNTGKLRAVEPIRTKAPRAGNPRPVEPVRARNPRPAEPIRVVNSRAAGRVRPAGAVRTGKPRTIEPIRTTSQYNRADNIQRLNRQKVRRRQRTIYRSLAALWVMVLAVTVFFMGKMLYQNASMKDKTDRTFHFILNDIPVVGDSSDTKKPEIVEDFLTISEYNRPGTKLGSVNNIFVHYTANPKTSAAQNRSYFESLGETHERAASAHFIIGYEGEIIQCIPLEEEAYAVVDRNKDSISIECCFIEEDGSFTQETYDSLIAMLVWLTDKYHLEPKDILRHYDCGGKRCPLYYVEHEDAWEKLLYDVEHYKL